MAREARRSAGLRKGRGAFRVRRRGSCEDDARDDEDERREPQRVDRGQPQRVVDGRADVPVRGGEEGGRPEHPLHLDLPSATATRHGAEGYNGEGADSRPLVVRKCVAARPCARRQPWMETITGMIRMATMFAILIIGLIAGPAVSLYGSPTVSPVTAAAWASEPLPPKAPSSIIFFALSQAPPPEVIEIARKSPVTIVPISRPPSSFALISPATIGKPIGIK